MGGALGLAGIADARGYAAVDIDRDGDSDLVVNNYNATVSVYVNTSPHSQPALTLKLQGNQANRDAIGAEVFVTVGTRTIHRLVGRFAYTGQFSKEFVSQAKWAGLSKYVGD